jgi:trigger factor
VQRAQCAVGEAQLERTIDIMRRQRATYAAAGRPAADGDRLTVDFTGSIDGAAFQGGSATDFVFPLGEGRMLPEFEQAARGMEAGQQKTFGVTFPPDYRANDLAGKAAQFTLTLKAVEAATLPAVDAAFAKSLGVPDGDVARMRADIKGNLEREVARRLRTRTRESAMEALLKVTSFDLPRALVDAEATRLAESARADLVARGVQAKDAPLPTEVFTPQAERRVRLGLILAEIVRSEGLQARQDQIRKSIEEVAQSYEKPAEVIQWYLSNRERVAEIETVVIEDNVVNWTMAKAKVSDVTVPFDELMGRTG